MTVYTPQTAGGDGEYDLTVGRMLHLEDGIVAVDQAVDTKTPLVTPVRTVTGSTTLALADIKGIVVVNSATATNVTVPAFATVAFTAGADVRVANIGAGLVTVLDSTTGTPVTYTTLPQGGVLRLECVAQNVWLSSQ